ncbi:MAG: hypothetical protein [Circular genetic element sp.]|nr:MAG: hypothetical protein [Circular genetic element sp.]
MGRSKNLHIVQKTIVIEQPNDASENWAEGYIQVDAELSKELGRTIRNGNSFRLVGYGATLKGFYGSSDQDIGFAGVAAVNYCPVTKNSVGAWQAMQKQWYKQKALSSGVGKYVRYDDFEVGWTKNTPLISGRQSFINMTGITDNTSERVVLYGTSTDGNAVSLEDYYNSTNPIPQPSNNPFGSTIKLPKFSNKFPEERTLTMPTSFSGIPTVVTDPVTGLPVTLPTGGLASGDIQWLPSDNHLSHMTGTLFYYFKGVTPDNAVFFADELKLTITLVYEGWASLTKIRSAKPTTRRLKTTAARGKKTTRARRRS